MLHLVCNDCVLVGTEESLLVLCDGVKIAVNERLCSCLCQLFFIAELDVIGHVSVQRSASFQLCHLAGFHGEGAATNFHFINLVIRELFVRNHW